MLLPVGLLLLVFVFYKLIAAELLCLCEYIGILVCFVLFWSNSYLREFINMDVNSFIALVSLLLSIIFTIAFPYTKQNTTFGIRISLTLDYPEVWDKAHRVTSVLISWTWIPLAILIFYLDNWIKMALSVVLLVAPLVIGTIYAMIIGSSIEKREYQHDMKELEDQIKREQGYR